MRAWDEIASSQRLFNVNRGEDGLNAMIYHPAFSCKDKTYSVQASDGMGWEHVSVAHRKITPSWDDMCIVKDVFYLPDEVVIQYHPARSEYVNNHAHCLHMWRPIECEIPTPPGILVGFKELGELPL